MKEKLKIKIPFWYKPFIRFMPNFWEELPEEKSGKFKTQVILFYLFGERRKPAKGNYTSIQRAYLMARWRAFWVDFFDFSERGIGWVIKKDTA